MIRTDVAPHPAAFRLSWGAIFGGTVVALATWALLYALGLALGLSSVDPANPSSLRGAGIGTGVWSVIAPLIAMFIGGWVAARTAGIADRGHGAIHGAVLWGLSTIGGIALLGMLLSSLLGSVGSLGAKAVSSATEAVSQNGGGVASSLGLDANDLVAPLNQRLRAEGKPEVTPQQVQAATRDIVQDAVRTGSLNRQSLVNSIASTTSLAQNDAQELATRVETQFTQARAQLSQQGENLKTGALTAVDRTGKAFWGIFAALLLGALAAILGGSLGVARGQRVLARDVTGNTAAATGTAAVASDRREVYP